MAERTEIYHYHCSRFSEHRCGCAPARIRVSHDDFRALSATGTARWCSDVRGCRPLPSIC